MRIKHSYRLLILIFVLFSFVSFCSKGDLQKKKGDNKSKISTKQKSKQKKLTRKDIMKKFNIKSRKDFQKLSPEQRAEFFSLMKKLREQDSSGSGGLLPLVKIK